MTTFTDGYGGDVNTETDTFISVGNPDTDFGAYQYVQLLTDDQRILLQFNLSSIPDTASISSATLYLYQHDWGSGLYTGNIHRILSANNGWTESSTHNYKIPSTVRWAGDTGGDGGSDAGCSVADVDYNSSSMGLLSGDSDAASGTEMTVTLNTTQVEAMLTADYGLIIIPATGTLAYIWSAEASTTGYRPKLVIEYTSASSLSIDIGLDEAAYQGTGVRII